MKRMIFLLGTILGFTMRSFSQIQGDITDPNDKGIPNAMIIAIDSARKTADTVKSDNRGFYEFSHLKPGKYRIEVRSAGFKPVVLENIIVDEDHTGEYDDDLYSGQRLDITLNPLKAP